MPSISWSSRSLLVIVTLFKEFSVGKYVISIVPLVYQSFLQCIGNSLTRCMPLLQHNESEMLLAVCYSSSMMVLRDNAHKIISKKICDRP